jgi:hypothetical protein
MLTLWRSVIWMSTLEHSTKIYADAALISPLHRMPRTTKWWNDDGGKSGTLFIQWLLVTRQGNQIGGIFDIWATFLFLAIKKCICCQNFLYLQYFLHEKSYALHLTKYLLGNTLGYFWEAIGRLSTKHFATMIQWHFVQLQNFPLRPTTSCPTAFIKTNISPTGT